MNPGWGRTRRSCSEGARTGLPTADNTHEVAQRVDPFCKIVYVDNNPIVLARAHALLNVGLKR